MNRQQLEKIFEGEEILLEKLLMLDEKREKIVSLLTTRSISKPMVITLLGSPRTGKTTISSNIYDFFKKCGLRLGFAPEPANEVYKSFATDEEKKAAISDRYKFNKLLRDFAFGQVSDFSKKTTNIVLCDRGYLDPYIWMIQAVDFADDGQRGDFEAEVEVLSEFNKRVHSILFSLYAQPFESIRRDYVSSLSLEDRKFIREENLVRYNDALMKMQPVFESYNSAYHFIDTSNKSIMDVSISITDYLCDEIIDVLTQRKAIETISTNPKKFGIINPDQIEEAGECQG